MKSLYQPVGRKQREFHYIRIEYALISNSLYPRELYQNFAVTTQASIESYQKP